MKTLFDSKIGLSKEIREQSVGELNQILADITDLYSQSKHAHWNVRGKQFYSQHLLFDQVASTVEEHIDPLAERITTLGGRAQGTVRQSTAHSRLPEFPLEPAADLSFVIAMIERFSIAAEHVRKAVDKIDAIGDTGTTDLLTVLSRDLDKSLWFLEAHTR